MADSEKVHLDDLVVLDMLKITLIISGETCKEVNSTSFNLKQEVFIRRDEDWPEESWYFIGKMDLTLVEIKDELWRLIFTPCLEVDWSMISVSVGVRWLVQLSLKCEDTFSHLIVGVWEMKEWHYLIHVRW